LAAKSETSEGPSLGVMAGLVTLGVIAIGVARVWLAADRPLWFDEAFTLSVATAPDAGTFLAELLNDVNAPLYYGLMRLWTALVGSSDLMLRAPGLICVFLAGLIAVRSKVRGLSPEAQLTWAAMIFAWWGVGHFLDGRGYALLLAVSTVQTVLFIQLMAAPDRRKAWLWCAVAAAAILIQYYALIGVAAQGVIFLAARRKKALAAWPALLAFAPALAWMALHAPRLRVFADASVAWHDRVEPMEAVGMAAFAVNPSSPLIAAAVAVALIAALMTARPPDKGARPKREDHLWLAAAAGALALALTLLSGMLHPSLTPRYLMPAVPGLLLGVVLIARRSTRANLIYLALIILYLGAALRPDRITEALRLGSPYGYEAASDVLMRQNVSDVVFIWDHEVAHLMAPASLDRLGAVFFARAGHKAKVTALAPGVDHDLNGLALAAASGPRPGIIWIYNRTGATSARRFPPRIAELDPRWTCERSGDEAIGALACYRR
jgi:hypothetical protein